ncbi:MAG TPA: aminotransferase class V-fold PLP-dependent enzyme [Phycisphaerales bacterium]|nr:aminotransferase class V-fold PLP-dependent enzyme [Phycisphaerales bacterium]
MPTPLLSRRQAIGSIFAPAAGAALSAALYPALNARAVPIASILGATPASAEDAARDEDFWAEVGRAFTLDRSIINLNNGGVSPSPAQVQEAMKRHLEFSNTKPPPYALWQILEPQKEAVRERLARQWGVDAEELAITRNASESLQTCQFGLPLSRGDEVLTTTQDYPRMINTFKQRERREGIVLKQFKIPTPCESPDAIIRAFESSITDKTRMILCSHVVFLTGQVLPVNDIAALGRKHNIPVIVDGAHAFAHLDYRLSDLDCDYYGTSLHKWLFAPHGTGLLYVRRDKVKDLWALMAPPPDKENDIRKFEEIGTHPAANHLAIAEALTFYQAIGPARKEARMRYMRDRWAKRLIDSGKGRVRLHTSLKREYSCGLATMHIDDIDHVKLVSWLWDKHRIFVVRVELKDEFEGIRVSPSVYTTPEELDRFCECIEWAMKNSVPA